MENAAPSSCTTGLSYIRGRRERERGREREVERDRERQREKFMIMNAKSTVKVISG